MARTQEPRTLFVAATVLECESLVHHFGGDLPSLYGPPVALHDDVDIIVTGVGSGSTGLVLGRWMDPRCYDVAYHFGICGSFHESLPIGSVVRVGKDCYADLGAETDGDPIDLFQMNLLGQDDWPYEKGWILAGSPVPPVVMPIQEATGVSVHRVLSRPESIEFVRERYHPDVVTMESAAFLFGCSVLGIAGFELRCVSDLVGPRDKSKWRITEAVAKMTEVMKEIASTPRMGRRPYS